MAGPVAPMADEADVLEDAQMLRDRGPADREPCRKLSHRARAGAKELEDLPPRRVAECVQRMSVSNHLP
jgi:hypothetical protein